MKFVTRKLLKFRPGSELVGPVRFRDRGREPKECWKNANVEFQETGNQPVSGWVVSPRDNEEDYTLIVRHYWNRDPEGHYYDTTPFRSNDHMNCDYVKDWEVYWGIKRMYDEGYFEGKSANCVPDMLYRDGRFVIADMREGWTSKDREESGATNWYRVSLSEDEPASIDELVRAAYMDGEFEFCKKYEKDYEIA